MKRLLILGGGTAGTMIANKMVRQLDARAWKVTVIDRDIDHIYQPGLLFLPFGMYRENEMIRPRASLLAAEVELVLGELVAIDRSARQVVLADGAVFGWDLLVLATGTRILPDETEGMVNGGWHRTIFDFYTLEGARGLQRELDTFKGGRVAVHVVDNPIKCPVAPLEFLFLADAFFTERGIRDAVDITYVTPLDAAFTKPKASAVLGDMLEQRGIGLTPDFGTERIDAEAGVLHGYGDRSVDFDLLVTIPLHGGAQVVTQTDLSDASGFVKTDKHTLQSRVDDTVFALGDATDLPASKAGAVAHFQADVLVDNLLRAIEGRALEPAFDGHANCFIETGFGKAMLIDFNYETEPLPGRFPLPGLGPFSLLEESHINHWGKLGFKWMYWNVLMKGGELPLDHRMALAGKWS